MIVGVCALSAFVDVVNSLDVLLCTAMDDEIDWVAVLDASIAVIDVEVVASVDVLDVLLCTGELAR